jgi:outer membrane protein OmpA-like peptidoglycan-associated protein
MTSHRAHIAIFAILAFLLSGCGQKTAKTDEPTAMPVASAPAAKPAPTAQPQRSPAEPPAPMPKAVVTSPPMAQQAAAPRSPPPTMEDFTDEPALKDVFFDAGRADIGRIGARLMRDNGRWIIENPGYLILIEGHTDYKGTRQSNLAMAEQRAKAAASALVKQGVPGTRLWTVSHGSDRPVCAKKTDACAAKNRRVHFRVKKQ